MIGGILHGWLASFPPALCPVSSTARCCLAPRFLPHRRGLITTRCSPAPAPHWPHLAFLAVISEIIPRPAVNCHRSAAAAACPLTRDHSFSAVCLLVPAPGSTLPLLFSILTSQTVPRTTIRSRPETYAVVIFFFSSNIFTILSTEKYFLSRQIQPLREEFIIFDVQFG